MTRLTTIAAVVLLTLTTSSVALLAATSPALAHAAF